MQHKFVLGATSRISSARYLVPVLKRLQCPQIEVGVLVEGEAESYIRDQGLSVVTERYVWHREPVDLVLAGVRADACDLEEMVLDDADRAGVLAVGLLEFPGGELISRPPRLIGPQVGDVYHESLAILAQGRKRIRREVRASLGVPLERHLITYLGERTEPVVQAAELAGRAFLWSPKPTSYVHAVSGEVPYERLMLASDVVIADGEEVRLVEAVHLGTPPLVYDPAGKSMEIRGESIPTVGPPLYAALWKLLTATDFRRELLRNMGLYRQRTRGARDRIAYYLHKLMAEPS